MKAFRLSVLTPERDFYTGDCVSLTVPLADGSYGIMASHSPLIAAIVPGQISFTKPDGERVVCAVSSGMVDAGKSGVRVLCETVLLPEEIDEEKQRQAEEAAAAELSGGKSYKDYMISEIMFAKAVNELRAKKHAAAKINNI